jgi:hypothetical protein
MGRSFVRSFVHSIFDGDPAQAAKPTRLGWLRRWRWRCPHRLSPGEHLHKVRLQPGIPASWFVDDIHNYGR